MAKKASKVPKLNKITLSTLSPPPLGLIHFFKMINIQINSMVSGRKQTLFPREVPKVIGQFQNLPTDSLSIQGSDFPNMYSL